MAFEVCLLKPAMRCMLAFLILEIGQNLYRVDCLYGWPNFDAVFCWCFVQHRVLINDFFLFSKAIAETKFLVF